MGQNDNYPPGTWEGDPRAPWNQPDPWEGRTCSECNLCGTLGDERVCLYEPIKENGTDIEAVESDQSACEGFED